MGAVIYCGQCEARVCREQYAQQGCVCVGGGVAVISVTAIRDCGG